MPAPAAPVARSALRLSEVARHVVVPSGIVDSLWYEVAERCAEFGDTFDTWQDGLGQVILGLRADGMFAATVGGVTFSIPRQVAKTFIVGRIVVALCTIFPNLTVLWTAHRTRTATRTFQTLKGVVQRPGVVGYLKAGSNNGTAIRDANGEQAIPFANGSEILFGAREGGFGRGFDEVDIEVFDEGQILTDRALEDMVAATNQSRWLLGALLFFMGTPPRPIDRGEVFTERRAEALEAKRTAGGVDFGPVVEHGDALYVECSADLNVGRPGGPDLDDPRQVEIANPSYPHRTPPIAVRRLRKNLPGDDSWRREGLGVWDEDAAAKRSVIRSKPWRALAGPPLEGGQVGFGVKVNLDGDRVALAVARQVGGSVFTEVLDVADCPTGLAPLATWLAPRLVEGAVAWIDGKAGSGLLLDELRRLRAPMRRAVAPTVDQIITMHSDFLARVTATPATLSHSDQPGLNEAVAAAGKRKIHTRGGWAWDALGDGDVLPLEAVTLAVAAATSKRATPPGGRTAAVREYVTR